MTELTPSFHDQSPLYDQLYRYIVAQIRSGALPAGESSPLSRSPPPKAFITVMPTPSRWQVS